MIKFFYILTACLFHFLRAFSTSLINQTAQRLTPRMAFTGMALASISTGSMAASVSTLLISEIMANPSQVSDANGEWFELYNPGTESVNLNGLLLSDAGSNQHTINSTSELLIAPGSYFVLARNGDTNSNGGLLADYIYGSGFGLNNTSDQITLTDSNGDTLSFSYSGDFVASGTSRELSSGLMTIDQYNLASSSYGLGDLGTPGTGSYNLSPSPVPLPAAVWLLMSGLLGLGVFGKRRGKVMRAGSSPALLPT